MARDHVPDRPDARPPRLAARTRHTARVLQQRPPNLRRRLPRVAELEDALIPLGLVRRPVPWLPAVRHVGAAEVAELRAPPRRLVEELATRAAPARRCRPGLAIALAGAVLPPPSLQERRRRERPPTLRARQDRPMGPLHLPIARQRAILPATVDQRGDIHAARLVAPRAFAHHNPAAPIGAYLTGTGAEAAAAGHAPA